MGNKGSFVFYTEYREHLSMLPPEQVGELMFALMDYQETGEVPDLPKVVHLPCVFLLSRHAWTRTTPSMRKNVSATDQTARRAADL